MDLLVFGHAGARAIVFPTSMGKFFEWEDQGMIRRARRSSSSADGCSSTASTASTRTAGTRSGSMPGDRAYRHAQYDAYVRDEVLPLTRQKNGNPFLMTMGASFGAYHAVTFALRYPHLVEPRDRNERDVRHSRSMTDGYSDANVYPLQPGGLHPRRERPGSSCARSQRLRHHPRDRPRRFAARRERRVLAAAVVEGHLARAADLGRLGARLAVLAGDDPDVRRRPD